MASETRVQLTTPSPPYTCPLLHPTVLVKSDNSRTRKLASEIALKIETFSVFVENLTEQLQHTHTNREMALGLKALHLSFAVHFLAVVGAILVLIWCISFRGGLAWDSSDKSLIFNLHPVLMFIGYIIIGGEAIVSYKSLPLKKPEKKLIHLVLHAIAFVLGIIGIYTAFKYHNESNIANLYSLHSWLGIGVIVLYGIQWVYGFLVFFFPGGTPAIRSESLPWHVLFGIFVYILAVGTAALGYLEKLTFLENSGLDKYGTEAFLVNFTAIVTVLFGTFVILTTLCQAPPEDEYSYSAI